MNALIIAFVAVPLICSAVFVFVVVFVGERRFRPKDCPFKLGDRIVILSVETDDPLLFDYPGRIGTVRRILPDGSIMGTWGEVALRPWSDRIVLLPKQRKA